MDDHFPLLQVLSFTHSACIKPNVVQATTGLIFNLESGYIMLMFSDLNYQEVTFSTFCDKMETTILKYHLKSSC